MPRHLHVSPTEKSPRIFRPLILGIAATAALATAAVAQTTTTLNFTSPTFDKNGYPFSGDGGGPRKGANLFAAFDTPGAFDDRDSTFIVGFDTAGLVQTGLGASNYTITSATFTLSLDFSAGDRLMFDGSYDSINTYTSTGAATGGDDPGRAIELYGAGYRGGYTTLSVQENSPIVENFSSDEGVRFIYPTDFKNGATRDVSNNLRDQFDTVPFAIGQVAPEDLNSDGTIKAFAKITFTLNLANPDVVAYLQEALNVGRLTLVASALLSGSQGGAVTYPVIETKETVGGVAPALNMQVIAVPEPSSILATLTAVGTFAAAWRPRRRLAPLTA